MRQPRMRTQLASLCVSIGLVLSSCASYSAAGSYSIDAAKTAESMVAVNPMGAGAKVVKMAKRVIREALHCRLELRPDGTATLAGGVKTFALHERWDVTGTWALEGEALTIAGVEGGTKNKVSLAGTYKDGIVALQPENVGFTLTFRRIE